MKIKNDVLDFQDLLVFWKLQPVLSTSLFSFSEKILDFGLEAWFLNFRCAFGMRKNHVHFLCARSRKKLPGLAPELKGGNGRIFLK